MAKKRRKKKRYINAQFLWLLSALAGAAFIVSFGRLSMLPFSWTLIAGAVVGVILLITLALSTRNQKSYAVKTTNLILCGVMLLMAWLLPVYQNKISELFNIVTGDISNINFYVLNEKYRQNHPEQFADTSISYQMGDHLNDLFITSITADALNAAKAVSQVKEDFGTSIQTTDRSSYIDALQSLYRGDGDVLIMSASFEAMIADNEEYERFRDDLQVIYSVQKAVDNVLPESTTALTKEPFIVFFGGNDEEGDLYLEGKTDVDMMVTVNPNSHQIAIVSLPRDSYVDNPVFGYGDKLTHLGMQGIDNTLLGLKNYLGQQIDNYVIINFTTFKNIIDALGGVDIYNEYGFTAINEMEFPEGELHLEGDRALMFVRERYSLPDGDFGRNYHQQQVMHAIIDKITSPEVIVHVDDLLDALEGTFLTNLTSDSIYALCRKQLEENISWNIVSYHVLGLVDFAECASAPGMELSVVFPYPNQVRFVSRVMSDVIEGRIVEQQELPYGEYDYQNYSDQTYDDQNEYYQEYPETNEEATDGGW